MLDIHLVSFLSISLHTMTDWILLTVKWVDENPSNHFKIERIKISHPTRGNFDQSRDRKNLMQESSDWRIIVQQLSRFRTDSISDVVENFFIYACLNSQMQQFEWWQDEHQNADRFFGISFLYDQGLNPESHRFFDHNCIFMWDLLSVRASDQELWDHLFFDLWRSFKSKFSRFQIPGRNSGVRDLFDASPGQNSK